MSPKPFVFVLMPFDERFKDIYILGIKQACIESETYCERVDEQLFEETIPERIYNQIAKADIIISDLNGVFLDGKPQIKVQLIKIDKNAMGFHIRLDIYNPSNKVLDGNEFQIGLMTPCNFQESINTKNVISFIDDENKQIFLHVLPTMDNIFPRGWESLRFSLLQDFNASSVTNTELNNRNPEVFEMTARVFTEFGPIDFPFSVHIGIFGQNTINTEDIEQTQQYTGSLAEVEKNAIISKLLYTKGNKSQAAQELGISRSTLREKMKLYAISLNDTTN
ncbi:helix-turn-helix domain-containing protein [candidate division KSB1 bacterium]|nr:helix-turn-helix domain-containing protein [candidate division KSB1 bacterium]